MTCKDNCLHYEVCGVLDEGGQVPILDANFCGCFKEKSNYAEVVRCKDCVSYNQYGECEHWQDEYRCPERDENDFCSDAERR